MERKNWHRSNRLQLCVVDTLHSAATKTVRTDENERMRMWEKNKEAETQIVVTAEFHYHVLRSSVVYAASCYLC